MPRWRYEFDPPITYENLDIDTMLHLLRNPWGHDEDAVRQARLKAADMIDNAVRNGWIPVTFKAA